MTGALEERKEVHVDERRGKKIEFDVNIVRRERHCV